MQTVFAYLDIENLAVAWGAYRGVLVSAHAEPTRDGCPLSMMLAGMVSVQNTTRLRNELQIEVVRQQSFSSFPSRLSAMYFFESEADAKKIDDWGGHFVSENLAELELHPTVPPSRHDSNWITHAECNESGLLASTNWIHSYWQGETFPSRTPVWELLVHGRAVMCGTSLRERAYEIIRRRDPLAVSILEVSRLAALAGSDLGQVKAFLIDNRDGTASINYLLDMRDAESPSLLSRLAAYRGPKNWRDLAVGGDTFQLPRFSEYSCILGVDTPLSSAFVARVHANTKQ